MGPHFQGPLPLENFARVIVSPSEFVALATRTAIAGAADLDAVIAVQEQLRLRPLSEYLGVAPPPAAPTISFPPYTPAVYGSDRLFGLLNFLLPFHTVPEGEVELLRSFARIGVGPYATYAPEQLEPALQQALADGAAAAHRAIEDRGNALGTVIDGWQEIPPMGTYGSEYLFRSAVGWKFIYTNSPEEALYPIAETDATGQPLSGQKRYVLHFGPEQMPPVDAFWSVTLYDSESRLMVKNPIDRFSIGDRTAGLRYGEDGSLTIHISARAAGIGRGCELAPGNSGALLPERTGLHAAVCDAYWRVSTARGARGDREFSLKHHVAYFAHDCGCNACHGCGAWGMRGAPLSCARHMSGAPLCAACV